MASQLTLTFTGSGQNIPSGSLSIGPISDVIPAALEQKGTLLTTTSYQGVTVPAGASQFWCTINWPSGGNNVVIGGGVTDAGINTGSLWTGVYKTPVTFGGVVCIKCASNSNAPTVAYEWD